MKYVVVYEESPNNFSAFVPDLPGCVATGVTRDEVKRNIREAITFHLEGMKMENLLVPSPSAWVETLEISA